MSPLASASLGKTARAVTSSRGALLAGLSAFALVLPACSSDDNTPATVDAADAAACLPGSGPTQSTGEDTHCIGDDGGRTFVVADTCPDASLPLDTDAGVEPLPGAHDGTEVDDDDCKYHVKYSVSCVSKDQPVTFTVTLTSLADGTPVPGANPKNVEGALGNTRPLPNTTPPTTATEKSPGVYTIGPVVFDASGKWLVRFHFFETCNDTEDSKHGHAAFFVNVP